MIDLEHYKIFVIVANEKKYYCCNGILNDDVKEFGKRTFSKGSLGFIDGKDVMKLILNILGKLPLIGA